MEKYPIYFVEIQGKPGDAHFVAIFSADPPAPTTEEEDE